MNPNALAHILSGLSGTSMISGPGWYHKPPRGEWGIKKYRAARKKKNKAARAARKRNRK